MKTLVLCLLAGSSLLARAALPITTQTPVEHFELPTFNRLGNRSMLIQGYRAVVRAQTVDLVDLNLTIFAGDPRSTVETVILSPAATVNPTDETVHGSGPVRVLRDNLEITGVGWSYDHRQKTVSIASHARIAFQAPLPDILK